MNNQIVLWTFNNCFLFLKTQPNKLLIIIIKYYIIFMRLKFYILNIYIYKGHSCIESKSYSFGLDRAAVQI